MIGADVDAYGVLLGPREKGKRLILADCGRDEVAGRRLKLVDMILGDKLHPKINANDAKKINVNASIQIGPATSWQSNLQ